MSDDETRIRDLIRRWAGAVHEGRTEEELAQEPGNRLRLTLGLRRRDGRWVVAHEHHSFPLRG